VTSLRVDLTVPARLLVLIGGGEFSFGETREIDEFLLRSMPADRRTVAFIPAASGSAEYAGHFGKYLEGIDPTVETVNVPIYRGRDSRRQKNLTLLQSAGVIYLGVVPTALAFSTWAYALARMDAGRLGVTTYVVPPITIVLSVLLLGELPPLLAVVGGAVCLVGVGLSRRR
jgi:uncharacterized membrane protein